MGRLSKRTIQCRAARKQRDLQSSKDPSQHSSSSSKTVARLSLSVKSSGSSGSTINFAKLGAASLRRYQQAYGLDLHPGSNKDDLVFAVKHHFQSTGVVDECSILLGFAQALRRDSPSDSSTTSGENND